MFRNQIFKLQNKSGFLLIKCFILKVLFYLLEKYVDQV